MKGIPAYSLLVKVAWGVFQRCVETTLDTSYKWSEILAALNLQFLHFP